MARPADYSAVQKALHWSVVLLLVINWFVAEGMGRYLHQKLEGQSVDALRPLLHTLIGWAVLILVLARLALRATRGAPPAPDGGGALDFAATAVHWALYSALLALPLTGIAAWYFGFHEAGEIHQILVNVIIGLAIVHIAGALYHQFVRKDGLISRMT